jgi:hypothetical protein
MVYRIHSLGFFLCTWFQYCIFRILRVLGFPFTFVVLKMRIVLQDAWKLLSAQLHVPGSSTDQENTELLIFPELLLC